MRRKPSGSVPSSAKQMSAPRIAPMTAVTADTHDGVRRSRPEIVGSARAEKFAKVKRPVEVKNPLPTASTAGIARNRMT